jgi:voltage-gated potassium channel
VTFRQNAYHALNPDDRLTLTARLLILLIIAATVTTVIETEPTSVRGRETWFRAAEIGSPSSSPLNMSCGSGPLRKGPCSRLRYALSPASIVDLAVVIASLLTLAAPNSCCCACSGWCGWPSSRANSPALAMMERAIRSRPRTSCFSVARPRLPAGQRDDHVRHRRAASTDQFGSIPRALWWSVAP